MDCSGTIDYTEYISKKELNSISVNRDYNFLMKVGRELDIVKDDTNKKAYNIINGGKRNRPGNQERNKRLKENDNEEEFAMNAAPLVVKRGVNVKMLPRGMFRSNSNKSGFDKKRSCFTWTIEWILLDNEGKTINKATSFRLAENISLGTLFPLKAFSKNLSTADNLKFYIRDYSTIEESKKLIELDSNQVLGTLLKGKTVIEYPTIYASHFDQTESEDSDNDSDTSSDSSTDDSDSSDSSSDSDNDDPAQDDISEKDTSKISCNNSNPESPPEESSTQQLQDIPTTDSNTLTKNCLEETQICPPTGP
ncbi:hypothetical protein LJB42_001037 [Komagataella kurtzmanii]|nr:hypothetical protein LJB42_001037 [Komagataella kurtzmanii]